jgi:hypothetical protein
VTHDILQATPQVETEKCKDLEPRTGGTRKLCIPCACSKYNYSADEASPWQQPNSAAAGKLSGILKVDASTNLSQILRRVEARVGRSRAAREREQPCPLPSVRYLCNINF